MSNLFNDQNVEIDEKKLRKMRYLIYLAERENFRTGRYSIPKMKDRIREIIIQEYKKQI